MKKPLQARLIDIEGKFQGLIERNFYGIAFCLLLFLSLFIRWQMAPLAISRDYVYALVSWVEHYKEWGFVGGLAQGVGAYYIPYNIILAIAAHLPWEPWVLIAFCSIVCDYISAYFVYRIARILLEGENTDVWARRKAAIAGLVTLFLPAVLMNGALWKQADSIYTCFLIICLYYALREKYGTSLLWLGIAFIFKMQAIFFLPLFIALYIFRKKGLSLLYFLYIPLCYLLGGLPAILAGRPAGSVYRIYFEQSVTNPQMTMKMPNLYSFNLTHYEALYYPALLGTLVIFILFMCAIFKYKDGLNNKNIVYLGIWCIFTALMFLPAMHERFNYPVLILLTVFYLIYDLKKLWIALIINLISVLTYGAYLFDALLDATSISMTWLAIFHMAAYAYVTYDVYRGFKEDKAV